MSKLSTEDCQRIEDEILGCTLDALSTEECSGLLGVNSASEWRHNRSSLWHTYHDHVKVLFGNTKDSFKWNDVEQVVDIDELGKVKVKHDTEEPKVTDEEFTNVKSIEFDEEVIEVPDGFEGDPYSLEFMDMCKMLEKLQLQKGVIYKTSWREDGDVGVYANIARKFHRIRQIVKSCCKGFDFDEDKVPKGAESYTEAIADEAVYCILDMVKRKNDNPDEFADWVNRYKLGA